ncbi:putative pathogenesis associated protein Cap20 [Pseudovirgaria hyperparasitica]|uniref:Putative pathogenesis associated protein Cap20 n=1 Tax=Pseudovirgaria hyperparasitica TaxID=470096 RepID=A0A6A6VV51_9PEZI|nr:putative pathogenesis associated protein Cap20 [Pseudovirgaria hyperparasitica]KAF2753666.1 putative pathogenesis associated protein Cap20 [Pseudovirgaria hyperparasitica]
MSKTQTLVNGDAPQSKILSHITSYPVVHDSIDYYKSNSYGQKSLNIASDVYDRFAKPFFPYLQTPYSYVKPYAEKADSLGDDGLSKIESYVPIVKEDTEKVKTTVLNYAFLPLRVAGEGKDYIFSTFNDEYKKTDGEGVFKLAKATISTEMRVGLDAYQLLYQYLTKAKDSAQAKGTEIKEKTNN